MDEFAPFGYQNFSQILNTARGTNTAFLFSMQSLPQLLKVGKGFKEDVTSAPNTKIALRDRKSTRLNSSHLGISYAVFCLKNKSRRLHSRHKMVAQTRQILAHLFRSLC